MITIRQRAITGALGLCLLIAVPLHAAPPNAPVATNAKQAFPFAGLTVLPDSAIRLPAPNQADYDFRRANALDTAQVEHVFLLRNDGTAPLTITGLEPSCHCTSAALEPVPGTVSLRADGSLPTLAPGQQMAVRMRVVLLGHPPGPFAKAVYVQAKGHDLPVAQFQAVGTLDPVLAITPAVLDFGALTPGETRTRTITVTYDARLAPNGKLPPLLSGLPSVRVAPASAPTVSPMAPGARVRTYRVTVRASQAVPVPTTLSFGPPPRLVGKSVLPAQTRADAFKTAAVTVLYSRITGSPVVSRGHGRHTREGRQ